MRVLDNNAYERLVRHIVTGRGGTLERILQMPQDSGAHMWKGLCEWSTWPDGISPVI